MVLAKPNPTTLLIGAVVSLIGLAMRGWASGHIRKNDKLAMSGPYAYTRNPLYLGSFILIIGVAVAARSWPSAVILFAYFALFYSFVMRREERELYQHHGIAFQEYARAVPLFFPRLTPAKVSAESVGAFSLAQYKKNREYRAAIGFLLLLLVFIMIWRLRLP